MGRLLSSSFVPPPLKTKLSNTHNQNSTCYRLLSPFLYRYSKVLRFLHVTFHLERLWIDHQSGINRKYAAPSLNCTPHYGPSSISHVDLSFLYLFVYSTKKFVISPHIVCQLLLKKGARLARLFPVETAGFSLFPVFKSTFLSYSASRIVYTLSYFTLSLFNQKQNTH